MTKHWLVAALVAIISVCSTAPVIAAVITITQAKANAGGVTAGDAPGFPVTLSQPGAYRLDTNLNVPAGKPGIDVRSQNVDIDMAGFRLYGWNAAGDTRVGTYGVYTTAGMGNIRGGFITGFRVAGIYIRGLGWTVEDMDIQSSGQRGVSAFYSDYARILNSRVILNGDIGIVCGHHCHVEGNTVSDNGNSGIFMLSGMALGNTIFSNIKLGLDAANPSGFGNNTIIGNNPGGAQVRAEFHPLHPNYCIPAC